MIICEDAPHKASEAWTRAHRSDTDTTLDPPPTYSPSQPAQPRPTTSERPFVVRPRVKPSNFTSIIRQHDSIKENFTIDPTMNIPLSLLPPLEPGASEEERKNLRLESHHGSINVGIFLAGGESGNEGRTTLDVRSTHGRIDIKLNTSATPRDPLRLTAHSTHNTITLHLPRSYKGLLTTTTGHGYYAFSGQLAAHITTFSETDSTRLSFVGDFSEWKEREEAWKGDEVTLTTKHGRIKVLYIDDEPAKGRSLLSRVLGLSG